MDDELKQLIYNECRYKMPDGLIDRFIGSMTGVRLKNREVLIPYGGLDTDIYILKRGIIRYCYFDGENERTYAFATPGTVVISYHPYYMRQPSFFQFESCGESVVMKISKKEVDELEAGSLDFARWMLTIHLQQLYFYEFRYAVINGTAKERYISLVKNRPEITARVPLKTIASYLGVTPNYLSRLKKTLLKGEKNRISPPRPPIVT